MFDPNELKYVQEVFSKLDASDFDVEDQLLYIQLLNDLMTFEKEMIAKYSHQRPIKFLIKL
ncbi:MAG: hypothetical protein J6U54_11315 [Clostridiales bacterium]|nr:hypothetical protein [Clostridiales bacterium]